MLLVVLLALLVTLAVTLCLVQRRLNNFVPRTHLRLLIEEAKYGAGLNM
jgi:hypothetical protein